MEVIPLISFPINAPSEVISLTVIVSDWEALCPVRILSPELKSYSELIEKLEVE